LPCRATLVTDAAAGLAQVRRPVQADHVSAGGGDLVQPQAAALGEHDGRDALAVVLTLQLDSTRFV
jgi:hypothetical protein